MKEIYVKVSTLNELLTSIYIGKYLQKEKVYMGNTCGRKDN